ncbi:MAG: DUF2804 domain-containing protein [Chitinophagales bacterium]
MTNYFREISDPVDEVVTNGQFNFGTRSTPVKKANLLDAEKPFRTPFVNSFKNYRLKEWQAFQFGNEQYFMMVAIYNAKALALAQFILFDIEKNKKYHYERKVMPWNLKVAKSLYGTESHYISDDFTILVENDLQSGRVGIDIRIEKQKNLPHVMGQFMGFHETGKATPLVTIMPFGQNRGMYSHKCLMPMEGGLDIGGKLLEFEESKSYMLMDDHKGYYPYPMKYDWVTAGYISDGKHIGFNLTDNQVLQKERFNENVLWVNGEMNLLPPVKFERENGVDGKWLIKDRFDLVNLEFEPVISNRIKLNLLLLRSNYYGPYGFFNGFIYDKNHNKIEIKNVFGMGEKFFLSA